MKKRWYWIVGIVVIIILVVILAFLLMTNIINPLDKSCNVDSDCVLAYTGLGACAPCDSSSLEMQCVSLREAEELRNRRNLLGGQALCKMCPTPQILYRCVCGQNECEKTTYCIDDLDCKTQSFREGYSCINNQCEWVGVKT